MKRTTPQPQAQPLHAEEDLTSTPVAIATQIAEYGRTDLGPILRCAQIAHVGSLCGDDSDIVIAASAEAADAGQSRLGCLPKRGL